MSSGKMHFCYIIINTELPNLGNYQRVWGNWTLEASGIWLQNFHRIRETDYWRAQTKPRAHSDPGERSSVPRRDWVSLACEFPGVSGESMGERLGLRQQIGREHSHTHQQKNGLKIYWAWPHPSKKDPISPTVSLFHQEASISFLSLLIRGQTEWKSQSQKINQTDPMGHSLV